ncbi:MAG: TlpA disulfide reductase family protein [Thermomicrobiales bacterium]
MIRRRALIKLGALGLLTACAPGGSPTPLATLSANSRQAAIAKETEVAAQVEATSEARAVTATARMLPTATGTPLPPTMTPTLRPPTVTATPRPPTATPPAAAAKLYDFNMAAYQGQASLGGDEVRFSSAFSFDMPVVVNFWAPLCAPCRDELPAFQRVSDEYAGRIFFIGVDVSPYWPGYGSRKDARDLIRETQIRYPVTYATESPLEAYRLYNLPATYFFAANGDLIERFPGGISEKQLRERVGKLVAARPAGWTA